jgi:hypothetical protein
MDNQAPPQFSADGRYWWNGEQWVPVDQLPKPLPYPSRSDYAVFTEQGARRRPLLLLLAAVGVVVLISLAAVGALGATGKLALPRLPGVSAGPSAVPSPTVRPTPMPTPVPTPVYIAGVTLQTILPLGRESGLTCMDVSEDLPGISGFCQVNKPPVVKRLVIYGNTGQHILWLRAVYRDDGPSPDSAAAAAFLGSIAALDYSGSNAAQAQAWTRAHVSDQAATTTIGSVTFRSRIEAVGHRFVLDIVPV